MTDLYIDPDCAHENRTAKSSEGVWECWECDFTEPMSDKDKDWNPSNMDHCFKCGHSEAFGGKIITKTLTFPYTRDRQVHVSCLRKD